MTHMACHLFEVEGERDLGTIKGSASSEERLFARVLLWEELVESATGFLGQKMQASVSTTEEESWMTLSQRGERLGIDKDSFESYRQTTRRSVALRRLRLEVTGETDASTRSLGAELRKRQTMG